MLEKRNIAVVLGSGIDTKTDPKLVSTQLNIELENARLGQIGSASKRHGYRKLPQTILGSSSTISQGKKLATYKDELLLVTGQSLYSYVPSNDTWLDRGILSSVAVSSDSVVRNTYTQTVPDVASVAGVTVYAWEDSRGGVRASVIDQSSGLPILSDVSLSSTGSRPKCSATPDYLYVHWMDSANTFKVSRVNPLSPTAFEAAATVASDANGVPVYDIAPHGNNLVCAYSATGGAVKTGYLKANGTFGGPTDGFPSAVSVTPSAASDSLTIASRFQADSNDAIYTIYHNTTDGVR